MSSVEVCIIGHPFAPIGMGEHVRSVFNALKCVYLSASIVNIYADNEVTGDKALEIEYRDFIVPNLCAGINIFCINGDEVQQTLQVLKNHGIGKGYNIIYPAWELESYPKEWGKQLEKFDEIWAPSTFIQKSIETIVSNTSIYNMPLACEVHGKALRSRRYFKIPESSYAFLFFFDFRSYVERKNPFAVLKTFKKLIHEQPSLDTVLVIKTNNGNKCPKVYTQFLKKIEQFNNRIVLINQTLTDANMKSLISLCDCFVSLHRSEGFGRGISEAMFLGKPVIATGYSGNMEFCTHDNSFLVDYKLIGVKEDEYPHWENQQWADPNIKQAAKYMKELLSNEAIGRNIGLLARTTLFTNFSNRVVGLRYSKRIKEIVDE